jgi:predicted HicB family RNase H-like nuclease
MTPNKGKHGKQSVKKSDVEKFAVEAEHGYDVDEILRRRGGRPKLGNAPSSVESVRLEPELKRDILIRAAERGISVSEAIREALREYIATG